jgi:SAM-dependent methyltransferase
MYRQPPIRGMLNMSREGGRTWGNFPNCRGTVYWWATWSTSSRAGRYWTWAAAFFAADGEHYVPTEQFDIIVFNEVLYFFRDPLGAVERYASSLRSGGILLVSICTAFKGGTAILERLKEAYAVLDETRVIHADNQWSWICVALARAENRAPRAEN